MACCFSKNTERHVNNQMHHIGICLRLLMQYLSDANNFEVPLFTTPFYFLFKFKVLQCSSSMQVFSPVWELWMAAAAPSSRNMAAVYMTPQHMLKSHKCQYSYMTHHRKCYKQRKQPFSIQFVKRHLILL